MAENRLIDGKYEVPSSTSAPTVTQPTQPTSGVTTQLMDMLSRGDQLAQRGYALVTNPSGVQTTLQAPAPLSPGQRPPVPPAAPPSGVTPGQGLDTAVSAGATPPAYDLTALEAMLAGLEAQYGLNREQLLAGEGEVANLYRFIVANLEAARTQAVGGVQEGHIRRGILRSGIAAENQARVENAFAQQQAQAAADRDQRLAQVALALQQLEASNQTQRTNTAVGFANSQIGTDEALAQALQLV